MRHHTDLKLHQQTQQRQEAELERSRRNGERRRRKEEEMGREEGRVSEEGRGWEEGSLEEEQGEDSCWSSWRNITPSPGRQCTEWLVICTQVISTESVWLAVCLKVIAGTVRTLNIFMVSVKVFLLLSWL